MNTYQKERHASDKLVVKIAEENPDVIKLIPAFEDGIKKQKQINTEIARIWPLQEKETSGVTENKNFNMDKLMHSTVDMAGAVYSYASTSNNMVLKGLVDYKRTTITHMSPDEIIKAAIAVCAEAKKVPPAELAKQGISAADLTTFEDMVAYFTTISASTRESIIERSSYTQQLVDLFRESRKLYKEVLDRLAHQFILKNKDFYVKYRAARKAIHRGPNDPDDENNPPKA